MRGRPFGYGTRARTGPLILGLVLCSLCLLSCREEGVSLGGSWEYQPGVHHNAQPVAAPVATPELWRSVEFPIRLTGREPGVRPGMWITFRRQVPDDTEVLLREGMQIGFFSGALPDAAQVFLNGVRIGAVGSDGPNGNAHDRYLLAFTGGASARSIRDDRTYLYLLVYYRGVNPPRIMDAAIRIGAASAITAFLTNHESLHSALLAVYLAVGFYHLLLFLRRRSELHNLYFGLFCLVVSFYWFTRSYQLADMVFGSATLARARARNAAAFLIFVPLLFFLTQLLEKRHARTAQIMATALGGGAFALLFANFVWVGYLRGFWAALAGPTMLGIVAYVGRAAWRGNKDARYLSGGVVFVAVATLYDALASRGYLPDLVLTRYIFAILILGIAGRLAARFVRLHNDVEQLNERLESQVEERTRQLQDTLTDVNRLKVQQDGDYFLTSLLLQPLGGISTGNEAVEVTALVAQKKRFTFRHWSAEIGGDLCTAIAVSLRGRPYTAFLNGDAMGKSLQGAGGALVLGTAFKSIVTRTLEARDERDRFPERWLRDCYLDLQSVFISFDGTMTASALLGLVDESNGFVYYVNAEHPWAALYRDGQASFIGRSLSVSKLGVPSAADVQVHTFPARPGDVIISGSDGRDDLVLGVDARNQRIINEDEDAFLRNVEAGQGELQAIYNQIRGLGEPIDDITLLRISVRACTETQADAHTLKAERKRCRQLLRSGRSLEAAGALEQLSNANPESVDTLVDWSQALRLAGNLEEGVAVGERVRLREHDHFRNLIHLAEAYRRLGKLERASFLIGRALELQPGNEAARRMAVRLDLPLADQ